MKATEGQREDRGREEYVTAGMLAARLNCHIQTVRRMAATGRIPSLRVGRDFRFDFAQVEAALTSH